MKFPKFQVMKKNLPEKKTNAREVWKRKRRRCNHTYGLKSNDEQKKNKKNEARTCGCLPSMSKIDDGGGRRRLHGGKHGSATRPRAVFSLL